MINKLNARRIALVLGLTGSLLGCASTRSIVTAREDQRVASLIATADTRSALQRPTDIRSIRNAMDRMDDKAKRASREVSTHLNLAELRLASSDLDGAEAAVRQAVSLDLNNRHAKRILATIALRRGNLKVAGIILNGLGGDKSRDVGVLNLVGVLAAQEQRYDDAMRAFRTALDFDTQDISARLNLAVLYLRHKQYDSAAAQLERVLMISPENLDAKLHFAIVKAYRGQSEEARDDVRAVAKAASGTTLATYNLAVAEQRAGELDDAVDLLKDYLKIGTLNKEEQSSVLALLDDIRAKKEAAGGKLSDAEIQQLAQSQRPEMDGVRTARKESKSAAQPTSPAAGAPDPVRAEIRQELRSASPGTQPSTATPPAKSVKTPDSISDLETMLEK